ncbi:DUF1552 domain-containing protein [bacterium]|nr:DUF1552 domain-containing protein [bacterium]
MSTHTRRQFLRGLGTCITLPLLESLYSEQNEPPTGHTALSSPGLTDSGAPLRMAFVCFPNGAHQSNWFPAGEGSDFNLGDTMNPLAHLKQSIQVLGGLDHKNAYPGHDGGGDHARGNATFLTGARARKTDSANIKLGVSIDQVVAQKIGHLTRFPSIELSCDSIRKSGNCDGGYSCAYQYNISWASSSLPMAPESNPRLVFERLFGTGNDGQRVSNYQMRQQMHQSILDVVLEDTRTLTRKLGAADKAKVDEYLTGLRDLEQRIERAERFGPLPEVGDFGAPMGTPQNHGTHIEMMYDLLALAFQTDSTRVSTLLLAHDGSNRSFPEIGVPDGHHDCSHHGNRPARLEKVAQIDLFYMQHFARFLTKLESMKDRDGNSVLHNSMIVYGSGNADGNRHTHSNLPVVLAGAGGGTLSPGRFAKQGGRPMTDLFLSMTDRMGVANVDRIGDSLGRVSNI